jgi:putative membrane protein
MPVRAPITVASGVSRKSWVHASAAEEYACDRKDTARPVPESIRACAHGFAAQTAPVQAAPESYLPARVFPRRGGRRRIAVAWHWMHGAGFPWGSGMLTMGILWIALLAVLLVAVVAIARPPHRLDGGGGGEPDTAREILRRRYTRGEIDGTEFEERMRRLS